MTLGLDKRAWKRVAFSDVVANINDYFDPATDGVLPYVAGPHINPGEPTVARYGSTDDDDFPPTFKRKFRDGDVLLHSRGIEKLAVVDRKGVTGEKLFVLRSKDSNTLDQRFLVWLLQSPTVQAHMRDNFTGSVNKFLNWKPMAAMNVDLPPLSEQNRIADLLWTVEREAMARMGMAKALEAVLDRWMAQVLREGSQLVRLADLIKFSIGGVWGADPGTFEQNVVVVRGTDMTLAGDIRWNTAPERSIKSSEAGTRLLHEGDLLIEKSGGSPDQPVGKVGLVGSVPRPAVPSNFVLLVRAQRERCRPEFLFVTLRGMWRNGHFAPFTGKTTNIANLRTRELLKVEICLPDMARQDELVRQFRDLSATVVQADAAMRTARAILSSLLAGVFGELA
ncbi:restriction endonuclease subunit S [Geodermatophilus nigrescens]